MAALTREKRQLDADQIILKADAREGRMAAVSADAERIYNDRLAVEGQQNVIALDHARVSADEKE